MVEDGDRGPGVSGSPGAGVSYPVELVDRFLASEVMIYELQEHEKH